MAGHVYHWKHGWIPLDHAAADLKAHGDKTEAHKLLVNAEVAKVAAGEKDVKHAQRTIDHAHGYAGKSVSELSDNQLKHEQLRAKDMHRFATGEEDKRSALAHHKEVQAELERRGHKTGRSVPVKSQEQKREEFKKRQAVANAAFEADRAKPAGEAKPKRTLQTISDSELAALEKKYSNDRTPIGTKRHQSILAEQDRRDLKTTRENFRWGVSDKVDLVAKERAKNFREGDRVVGYDQNGNRITGRLSSTTQARLKKARPFPGQKPFDTPGPRYDNTWMIKTDNGGLVRVAPHSVDKVGDNPDSRPASGSNVRGGLADFGKLQERSVPPAEEKKLEPAPLGKLYEGSSRGAIEAASDAEIRRRMSEIQAKSPEQRTNRDLIQMGILSRVKYDRQRSKEVSAAEKAGRVAPEHVRAAEQVKGAQEAVSATRVKPGKLKKGDVVDHPTGKLAEKPNTGSSQEPRTGIGSGRNPRELSDAELNSELESALGSGMSQQRYDALKAERTRRRNTNNPFAAANNKPEHVRAAEQFAGAKAEADRRRAAQTEGHNPFKAVSANDNVKSMSDADLRAERLTLNKKGLLSDQEEARLSALDAEIRNRDAAKLSADVQKNFPAAVKKTAPGKKVAGAPSGHTLTENEHGSLTLKDSAGNELGFVETSRGEVNTKATRRNVSGRKTVTSYTATVNAKTAKASGLTPGQTFEGRTRKEAATALAEAVRKGKAVGR